MYINIDGVKPVLLREKQMVRVLNVSKSDLWEGIKTGKYPAPVRISPRVTAWRVSDVEAWAAKLNPEARG